MTFFALIRDDKGMGYNIIINQIYFAYQNVQCSAVFKLKSTYLLG